VEAGERPAGPVAGADRGWQDRAGQAWSDLHAETDRQLAPLGALALGRLAPRPGERVIDVGCGCGQTLLQLASAVGPAGRVLGVDVSEVMLARARTRVAEAAATPPVEIACADAASFSFPARAFDAIFSRFGLMFFEHPTAAFQNLRAALAASGRLAFVSWQGLERNPWALVPLRAVQDALPDAPTPALLAPDAPGPFSLAEPARVGELLEGAGFQDVRIEEVTTQIQVGGAATVDEAMKYLLRIGPAARQLAESEPARRPVGEAALARAIAPYASERGVWMEGAVLLVTARP
jgi:SAM-dependent methyltransferase